MTRLVAILLLLAARGPAMVVNGFAHDVHSAAGSAFVLADHDLSGVTRNGMAWGTLVADQWVATSAHLRLAGSAAFGGETIPIDGWVTWESAPAGLYGIQDLALVHLARPAPAGVPRYRVADLRPLAGATAPGPVYILGDCQDGSGLGAALVRHLRLDSEAILDLACPPGYGRPTYGDSGGPTFLAWNGELLLLGTHWLINQDAAMHWHRDAIEAAAPLQYAEVTVVPEPCLLAIAAVAAGLGVVLPLYPNRI